MEINYLAVLVCAIVAMILGGFWYGGLFGTQWMKLIGVTEEDMAKQSGIWVLYVTQFILTLFQVIALANLLEDTATSPIEGALWIFVAFVVPTLAGAVMWTNEKTNLRWQRFGIQAGYQLCCFVIFGIILTIWQ